MTKFQADYRVSGLFTSNLRDARYVQKEELYIRPLFTDPSHILLFMCLTLQIITDVAETSSF